MAPCPLAFRGLDLVILTWRPQSPRSRGGPEQWSTPFPGCLVSTGRQPHYPITRMEEG